MQALYVGVSVQLQRLVGHAESELHPLSHRVAMQLLSALILVRALGNGSKIVQRLAQSVERSCLEDGLPET